MRSSKRAGRVGKLIGTRGLRLLPPWNWRYRPRYHLFTYFAILLPDYEVNLRGYDGSTYRL